MRIILYCFLFSMVVACKVSVLHKEPIDYYQMYNKNISIKIIAERDGQKLRNYLSDLFRDTMNFSKRYVLDIKLTKGERTFGYAYDGNAKRVLFSYTADCSFIEQDTRKVIFEKSFTVRSSNNIAAQGDVILSLYHSYDDHLLKNLSAIIADNIKILLTSENKKELLH